MRATINAFCLWLLTIPAPVGFFMPLEGETTITANVGIIREGFPDGRILSTAHKGTVFSVSGASGDGRGTWVVVQIKINGEVNNAYVDSAMTSFDKDMKTGRLHAPKAK